MNVLMLSSSRFGEYDYLAYAESWINEHLGAVKNVLFIPYAGITMGWDAYTVAVQSALQHLKVTGIHESDNPKMAIQNAEAILVGGGNTFNLLHLLYEHDLIDAIKHKVEQGTPYIGWSAGSNICGLSIRTTNDMPIIEPKSFDALHFVNAQLNPHYTDYVAPNFHGETRDQRLAEFCTLQPTVPVLAIREGSALLIRDNKLRLLGELNGFVFASQEKISFDNTQDLTEYL
ncbi:dipeptidase E [Glaciecola punicea]|jgi:dipeptidase E|uniref:dipeptidase PepE n=1 Tax=Glaciecola punicea TaxID=56804 RepID=UPI0008732718|nr:dipeptidase PepE [Glaciecola punicea]OFA30895.1 dipeptidase E [Glaciecola punicea]